MSTGSPPESTAYVLSGKMACCVWRWFMESGDEYTPFISLNTTPLNVSGACAAQLTSHQRACPCLARMLKALSCTLSAACGCLPLEMASGCIARQHSVLTRCRGQTFARLALLLTETTWPDHGMLRGGAGTARAGRCLLAETRADQPGTQQSKGRALGSSIS